ERMVSGGYGGGDIPVPIPNTAVKPTSADGTWGFPSGRVGRRRDFLKDPHLLVGVFRILKGMGLAHAPYWCNGTQASPEHYPADPCRHRPGVGGSAPGRGVE